MADYAEVIREHHNAALQEIADKDKIILGLRDAGDIALHFLTQIAINDETPPDLAGYAADGAKPLSAALANSDEAGERVLEEARQKGYDEGLDYQLACHEDCIEKARADEAQKVAGRLLGKLDEQYGPGVTLGRAEIGAFIGSQAIDGVLASPQEEG
jgi:hypothetical protein